MEDTAGRWNFCAFYFKRAARRKVGRLEKNSIRSVASSPGAAEFPFNEFGWSPDFLLILQLLLLFHAKLPLFCLFDQLHDDLLLLNGRGQLSHDDCVDVGELGNLFGVKVDFFTIFGNLVGSWLFEFDLKFRWGNLNGWLAERSL